MLRTIFAFIILLASVWLGIYLYNDPGYVLIALNHWTIETTLWVGLIGLIIFTFALHFLATLMRRILNIPSALQAWRKRKRQRKAQAKTRKGLIEFSEGYWEKAKTDLIKALPGSDAPLLNYLTAARAAQELGDYKLRDDYLREAQQSMPEAKIAVELTQAQLQLANQQWEQALATLQHLHDIAPNHPYVLKLLMKLYEQVRDWPRLITLLPEIKRNQVLKRKERELFEQKTYIKAIKDYLKHQQYGALEDLFATRPKSLAYNADVVALYCQYLIEQEKYDQVEPLLKRTLARVFNEELISLYGKVNKNGSRLKFAESLLDEHPHSPALMLCLGRLCKEKNLWGKARSYFEASIQYGATVEAYFELGKLLQQLNDQSGALQAFRQGLALTLSDKTP